MIEFSQPLIKGQLIKRYKRFFADVKLDDGSTSEGTSAASKIVTSHCPNTGSMKSCGEPGDTVYLLPNDDPKRKLRYTWEYTEVPGGFCGVNTQRPNRIVEEACRAGLIPELRMYQHCKTEQAYGDGSKIDILLTKSLDGRKAHNETESCYVEVKNVTLLEGDVLKFPDASTTRGHKHLRELTQLAQKGIRAVMFFLVNRPDGTRFEIASAIDPTYAALMNTAYQSGVEVLVYRVHATLKGMSLGEPVQHEFK